MTNHLTYIDTVFHALADPTRRSIVEHLSQGPASVGQLAKPFSMALPSFMQHIRILEVGKIITTNKVGRVRECHLRQEALQAIDTWANDRRKMWEMRLDNLQQYLDHEQKN